MESGVDVAVSTTGETVFKSARLEKLSTLHARISQVLVKHLAQRNREGRTRTAVSGPPPRPHLGRLASHRLCAGTDDAHKRVRDRRSITTSLLGTTSTSRYAGAPFSRALTLPPPALGSPRDDGGERGLFEHADPARWAQSRGRWHRESKPERREWWPSAHALHPAQSPGHAHGREEPACQRASYFDGPLRLQRQLDESRRRPALGPNIDSTQDGRLFSPRAPADAPSLCREP